jgi:hypothetical protein
MLRALYGSSHFSDSKYDVGIRSALAGSVLQERESSVRLLTVLARQRCAQQSYLQRRRLGEKCAKPDVTLPIFMKARTSSILLK